MYLALTLFLMQNAPFQDKMTLLMDSVKGCSYRVSSHIRTPAHNKRVGGADNSFHLTGRAVDVISPTAYCRTALENLSYEHGFTIIKYSFHTHIDDRKEQKCLVKNLYGFNYC